VSTRDYRLGIDVGETNTDAVMLDCSDQVRAKVKVPTTADVTSGIIAVLDAVVRSTGWMRRGSRTRC
jgi:N-methylhydantoinase A/oxoprolinase/acetone carboxylase beta subunit